MQAHAGLANAALLKGRTALTALRREKPEGIDAVVAPLQAQGVTALQACQGGGPAALQLAAQRQALFGLLELVAVDLVV
jgi:hypothetical protein